MPKHLLDTITFRHGATVANRLYMAPMLTFSGDEKSMATQDTIAYYSARSKAAGLLISEFHFVSETGGPCFDPRYPKQLGIFTDEHIESIKAIADSLKKDGNKAILQIHHGGREANVRATRGQEVLAPSAIDFSFLPYKVREMTNDEIEGIINDFGLAVKRAVAAGFDGVEIHGANHYLLQQFFSKTSNHRTDKWGGSLEKRMAFPLAVVDEVKRVVAEVAPKDFIIGYRISPEEIHGDVVGYDYKEATALIAEVAKRELDYIHLSLWGGFESGPEGVAETYPSLFKAVLDDNTKLLAVGSVFSQADAEKALESAVDLVGVGRGTLVDPLFGQKIMDGKGDTIVSEISPEQLPNAALTSGLYEAFTREDSMGLPPLPNQASINHLHTGKYER